MSFSLRMRLSVMMFLQYFVWGAWGVVIFQFIDRLPTEGGLDFPGQFQGWIGATLPIGAMISPIFIGLFADRFFATEKVLVVLHLLGAALLVGAAWTSDRNLTAVRTAFEEAARAEPIRIPLHLFSKEGKEDFPTKEITLLQAMEVEQALKEKGKPASASPLVRYLEGEAEKAQAELQEQTGPAIQRVSKNPVVQVKVRKAFNELFWILLGYAICYMPSITLTNSLSFRNLTNPDKYFGSIRVLGTIGWIVAGLVVGFFLKEASSQPLYLAGVASVLLGLFCFGLPHTPPAGKATTLGETLGLPALAMLKDGSFLVFFINSFLITIVLAFYFQQGNPFIKDLGASHSAAVMTLGQMSEIVFMLLIPVGLRWVGTKGMLMAGVIAWCLRFTIFATRNVDAVIWLGLPLHGICYDFFFVVSYLYVDRRAPSHLRASAQGLITFITLGLGFFIGNLLAGMAVAKYKVEGTTEWWTPVWCVPLAGSVAAALLFGFLFREPKAPAAAGVPAETKEDREGTAPSEIFP